MPLPSGIGQVQRQMRAVVRVALHRRACVNDALDQVCQIPTSRQQKRRVVKPRRPSRHRRVGHFRHAQQLSTRCAQHRRIAFLLKDLET